MDGSAFAHEVARLTLGKRMPDGVYVHVEALAVLPEEICVVVEAARALARLDGEAFQVLKLAPRGRKLSLLAYPGFFDEAFPTLRASWVVDLDAGTVSARSYAAEGNPPILHRKELLLPPEHTRREEYAALTVAAERLGLFTEVQAIGTRRPWEARLARLGVRVEGHRLVETRPAGGGDATFKARAVVEEAAAGPVLRHRTALQRYSLSTPMQALFRHGYLDGRGSVFDYGCGRGDDVRILKELGVEAGG